MRKQGYRGSSTLYHPSRFAIATRSSLLILLLSVACSLDVNGSWSLVADVQAQTFGRVGDIEASGVPYKVFTKPGEATVQVMVVGAVPASIYEVSANTELDMLLTLTGATLTASAPNERRKATVRLYRETGGGRTVIYEAEIEEVLARTERYPSLQDGDVVYFEVESRPRFSWREGLQIFSTALTFGLLIDRLIRRF